MLTDEVLEMRFALNQWVSVREEAGSISVLNTSTGDVFIINEIGRRILELCGENIKVSELITTIEDEYDVENDCAQDLIDFLKECKDGGLVSGG